MAKANDAPTDAIPVSWWDLVLDAYDAGVKRGRDESTAFEWGSYTSGEYRDELFDAIHEWMCKGLPGRDVPFSDAQKAVLEAMAARDKSEAE